jgi:hypothetical protein
MSHFVRLEVVVDHDNAALCGRECVYLDQDHENWSGATCDLFNEDLAQEPNHDGLFPRDQRCIAAEARDDSVEQSRVGRAVGRLLRIADETEGKSYELALTMALRGVTETVAILTAPIDSPPPAEVKPSELQGGERQRFVDAAAMRIMASLAQTVTMWSDSARSAYVAAEALWTERQKRIDEQHARGRK